MSDPDASAPQPGSGSAPTSSPVSSAPKPATTSTPVSSAPKPATTSTPVSSAPKSAPPPAQADGFKLSPDGESGRDRLGAEAALKKEEADAPTSTPGLCIPALPVVEADYWKLPWEASKRGGPPV